MSTVLIRRAASSLDLIPRPPFDWSLRTHVANHRVLVVLVAMACGNAERAPEPRSIPEVPDPTTEEPTSKSETPLEPTESTETETETPTRFECDATAAPGSDLDALASSIADGGTLCLAPGLHPRGLELVDRVLTVAGHEGHVLSSAITIVGGEVTLLAPSFDGVPSGPAIRIEGGSVSIDGGSIVDGTAAATDASGGIDSRDAVVSIDGLSVQDIDGTGLVVVGGDLELSRTEIRNCRGTYAGALIAGQLGELVMTDVSMTSNQGGALVGAAEIVESGRLEIDEVTLSNNLSTSGIGALYINEVDDVTLRNSRLEANQGGLAGGFELRGADTTTIENLEVVGNGTLGAFAGGFVLADTNKLVVHELLLEGNESTVLSAGGMLLDVVSAEIEDSTLRDNVSEQAPGGLTVANSGVAIRRTTFERNVGVHAGGVWCNSGELTIEDSTFTANAPTAHSGSLECTLTVLAPGP